MIPILAIKSVRQLPAASPRQGASHVPRRHWTVLLATGTPPAEASRVIASVWPRVWR